MKPPILSEKHLCDFQSSTGLVPRIVNDGVMGGVSSSAFAVTDTGTGVFRGEVSLENNGGFASVRLQPLVHDLTGSDAFMVKTRGDGHTYKFIVRTDTGYDGVNYRNVFQTRSGIWQEHWLPFAEFVPTIRGRILTGMPALNPANIETVGFLISDQQAGPFQLEVAWIKASAAHSTDRQPSL